MVHTSVSEWLCNRRPDFGQGLFEGALKPIAEGSVEWCDSLTCQFGSEAVAHRKYPIIKAARSHPTEFDLEVVAIELNRDKSLEFAGIDFAGDFGDEFGRAHPADIK